jgi:YD repeat-containing protein
MADGVGSLIYQYNSLSQITSETRQFSGAGAPSNSYTLSYQYNLAGALKKITDPSNVTINYNYDTAGRVTGVTGENNLVNNVSQYASNFSYRAWGAVKDKDYGSGGHSHVDYNARLLPVSATRSNVNFSSNFNMTWNYEYYADGRIQRTSDLADNRFDRLQEYDHVGRLKEAYSGREARGLEQTTPADNPYRQSMQYDAWDNLTSKSGRFWRQWLSDSGTYINNRRQYWTYDAEGNLLGGDGKAHTYDAAGEQAHVATVTEIVGGTGTGHPVQPGWEIAQTYNVEGKPVKRLETRRTEEMIGEGPQTDITETVTTTYYLYSSVLGTQVIELDGNGVKTKGYVYANGERLAKQEVNQWWSAVRWYYPNAGTNSWVEETNGGSIQRQEMDPSGAEVGTSDPYLNSANPSYYKDIHPEPKMLDLEGGDPFDFSGGHTLDGVPISQSQYNRIVGGLGLNRGVLADVFRVPEAFRNLSEQWTNPEFYRGSIWLMLPDPKPQTINQPQNSRPVPFQSVDELRAQLKVVLSDKKCSDFISTVINEVYGKMRDSERLGLGIDDLFENVAGQDGFLLVENLRVNGWITNGATDRGKTSIWRGNAQVQIATRSYFPEGSARWQALMIKNNRRNYLGTVLHELFHHLSKNGWGDRDSDLGRAAFKITGDTSGLPGADADELQWSSYFDDQLMKKCLPDQARRGNNIPPPP